MSKARKQSPAPPPTIVVKGPGTIRWVLGKAVRTTAAIIREKRDSGRG